MPSKLERLQARIVRCRLCPRLVEHRERVAREKRRAYRDWDYWGRPVPSFGDPAARLLIVGLAPGAHGANRTGRMFTGDSSGDLLYRVLYTAGFASQPHSISREDGLTLRDAYITAPVHCAPPDNKPTPEERVACLPYLEAELPLLPDVRVVVVLGRIAFDTYLRLLKRNGRLPAGVRPAFGHGAESDLGPGNPILIASYHPSQQNTSTGKLTEPMLEAVFKRAAQILAGREPTDSPGQV